VKLSYGAFCDYAGIDGAGKFNILGMFGKFQFEELPAGVFRFFIVLIMKAEPADTGQNVEIRVRLLDPNGTPAGIDQKLPMGPIMAPPVADSEIRLNLYLEVNGLLFHQYGMHQLIVEVDGKRVGKIGVGVRKIGATKA
jgi:hypothetical protein